MQVQFVNQSGKLFAPKFFTVYHKKSGKTFRRIEHELDVCKFLETADVEKIELYENGSKDSNPVLKDTVLRENFMCKIVTQYSMHIGKAV